MTAVHLRVEVRSARLPSDSGHYQRGLASCFHQGRRILSAAQTVNRETKNCEVQTVQPSSQQPDAKIRGGGKGCCSLAPTNYATTTDRPTSSTPKRQHRQPASSSRQQRRRLRQRLHDCRAKKVSLATTITTTTTTTSTKPGHNTTKLWCLRLLPASGKPLPPSNQLSPSRLRAPICNGAPAWNPLLPFRRMNKRRDG